MVDLQRESIIDVQWGQKKSQPEGPPFLGEMRLCRVSHWNSGPVGWDFFCPH